MSDFVPRKLRGYELVEMIGTGGFGVVYRAYQPAVDREVAIKAILPVHANDPEFVRRFEREARFIARLEHLHIIPIYDYWREPDGAYLVMRYLKGGNLLTSIQQGGAWPLAAAARLVDQIASALAVAHQNGIVHQDLKPENILLDAERNAYLSDFGIAKDLISPQNEPADRYGSPGYASPEQIVGQTVTPQSDIYSLTLVIYAMLTAEAPFQGTSTVHLIRKTMYEQLPWLVHKRPDLPRELDRVLRRGSAKDPDYRYSDALSLAIDFRNACALPVQETALFEPAITASPGTVPIPDQYATQPMGVVTQPLDLTRNPYKGLRAFDETDAADFFGRDELVNNLIRRMNDRTDYSRFLAVVGPSGSGKSSLVRAGLLPALRRGLVVGSERWFITTMVPGHSPLRELEEALLSVALETSPSSLYELMCSDDAALVGALNRLFPGDAGEVLLFIDQFEEVFSATVDDGERTRFLSNMITALRSPDVHLRVIITLRADFYDRPLLLPGFGDFMRERTAVVLPMNDDELRRAIIRPAENAGLDLEDDLAEQIVAEVHEQPGGLPLLQFALTELYERRDGSKLTRRAYEDIGGISGALIRRADDLYKSLHKSNQLLTRQIFLRLVTLGEGLEDTRRRVLRHEILTIGDRTAVEGILDAFGQYRLLTFDRDPLTRAPTVEIAHEALIRQWGRLRTWLENSRDDLRMQTRLAAATREWLNADRDPSFLAAGSRLAQLEGLMQTDSIALTADEQAYLQASINLRQRNVLRARLFMAGLLLITLVAVGLAVYASDRQRLALLERDRADEQADISRSRELAMAAMMNRSRLDQSLLLSLQALASHDTIEARRSLLSGLQANPRLVAFLNGHTDGVRSVAVSPDGRYVATGGEDHTILVYDAATYRRVGEPLIGHSGAVLSLAFSPDSRLLASSGRDGTVRLWMPGQSETARVLTGHSGEVWGVAFSPDGSILASAGAHGQLMVWDVNEAEPLPLKLAEGEEMIFAVVFSPDGRYLATGDAGSEITLWDMTDTTQRYVLTGHSNWVLTLAFSPDSTLLVSAGPEREVVLWDVEGREAVGSFSTGHTDWIRKVAFSPAGNLLMTASQDNSIRLWDLATIRLHGAPFIGHTDAVWDAVFDADGTRFYSVSSDGSGIVWRIDQRQELAEQIGMHETPVRTTAFSADERWLATGGGEPGKREGSGVYLWPLSDGQREPLALSVFAGMVSAVAFSPDSQVLAAGSEDTTVRLWDTGRDVPVLIEVLHQGASVTDIAFSPDGRLLAVADIQGMIRLFTQEDAGWQAVGEGMSGQGVETTSVDFSPDSRLLVAGYRDNRVILWDAARQEPVGDPLSGHTAEVEAVAFSADGRMVASGGRDNLVILWDVESGRMLREPLTFHTGWVTDIAFSPRGGLLASASRDNTIMLWDAATGENLGQPLAAHTNWVTSVAFSQDGRRLASVGMDRNVFLWNVSLGGWRQLACAIANPVTDVYRDICPAQVDVITPASDVAG